LKTPIFWSQKKSILSLFLIPLSYVWLLASFLNRKSEKKFNIPIIKGVNVKNKLNLMQSILDFEDICDILLFDAPSEALPGGNGKKFDWDILKDFKSKKKWMLAGGLNIENIEKAIDITKAPAIDISSGLEIMKGVKDPRLIENFIIKCKEL